MKMTIPPICVVDDDDAIREAVESLLRAEGFEVELFASAQRFMTRATTAPLSCVILDVELPGLSGLDLQRELSAAGISVPIIFLTGHGSIPVSVRAMKAGAVEFLTKPFDADDLLNAIQQAVSGTHSEELETTRALTDIVGESQALRTFSNPVFCLRHCSQRLDRRRGPGTRRHTARSDAGGLSDRSSTHEGSHLPYLQANPERMARAKAWILEHLESGALKPIIARVFPFDQIVEAHRYMESNEQVGKIIVTVP
jgi:FixJ family two-component response regulator